MLRAVWGNKDVFTRPPSESREEKRDRELVEKIRAALTPFISAIMRDPFRMDVTLRNHLMIVTLHTSWHDETNLRATSCFHLILRSLLQGMGVTSLRGEIQIVSDM